MNYPVISLVTFTASFFFFHSIVSDSLRLFGQHNFYNIGILFMYYASHLLGNTLMTRHKRDTLGLKLDWVKIYV